MYCPGVTDTTEISLPEVGGMPTGGTWLLIARGALDLSGGTLSRDNFLKDKNVDLVVLNYQIT